MPDENTKIATIFDFLNKVNENFEEEMRLRKELHSCLERGDYDREEFELLLKSATVEELTQLIHKMSEANQGSCYMVVSLIDEIVTHGCPSGCEEALKKLDGTSMHAYTQSIGMYRTT